MDTTRFAPSPTGRLHLGHAWSALFAAEAAGRDGRFLLRIEDIDPSRCKSEFEAGIIDDLRWLGLGWTGPVRRQSEHFETYRKALDRLNEQGLLYPCFCTRKDIQDEIARSPSAPHGPEGVLYPGICRSLSKDERRRRINAGQPYALRLQVDDALRTVARPLRWLDRGRGWQEAKPEILGDAVLARKETPASYHLCVTVDDQAQEVTLVTRGEDLFYATNLHRLLQALLGYETPDYHHHALLHDENGKRFAKRNNGVTLQALRQGGQSAETIRAMIGECLATNERIV
jgi:glutamyl-Q tRNA(Asp) synthetase